MSFQAGYAIASFEQLTTRACAIVAKSREPPSVHSVLQHMHVLLPANTAANNLQTGPAKSFVVCEHA